MLCGGLPANVPCGTFLVFFRVLDLTWPCTRAHTVSSVAVAGPVSFKTLVERAVCEQEKHDGRMETFVANYHTTYSWFHVPDAASVLRPGTIPLAPREVVRPVHEGRPRFDLSLAEGVVGHSVLDVSTDLEFVSLVSASGAGKTKTIFDKLKVGLY
jgi:hypothetical protein